MKYAVLCYYRCRWLNLPVGILLVLLQRTPVLRALLQTESVWETGVGDLLKSAFALAALGSYNSLAGATTFTVTSASGAATGAAKSTFAISGTTGTPINGATGVTLSVSGAPGTPKSFGVTDNANGTSYTNTLPPGLALNPQTGTTAGGAPYYNGSLKMTITGTPTTAGTYTVRFMAADSTALTGNSAYVIATFTIAAGSGGGGGGGNVAPAITTQPASQTVTAGAAVSFTAAASGTPTPTYQWQKDGLNLAGATGTTYSIASAQAADAGNYTFVATNAAGSATSNAATLSVSAAATAPSITTQPTSQTVTAGAAVTFSVTASGTAPLSYQWQKGGVAIAGATNSSYSIASVAAGDAGSYTVVVSNSAGTATSSAATLTVNAGTTAPSISTQPQSVTTTPGSSVSFSVTATGNPAPTYQWQKGGVAIAGATGASYSIASVATGDAGDYSVVVANSAGSVTSNTATLTVSATATAPAITAQPASQTVATGGSVTLSVTASGTAPFAYQWQKGGAAIAGATNSSYSIASVAAGDAGNYTVVVTNSVGSVTSAAATLTVSAAATAPTITVQPADQSAAPGQNVTFSVTANGSGSLTYQWQKYSSGTSAWANLAADATYSGVTSSTLTVSNISTAQSGVQVRVVVTNSAGSATSGPATLTVASVIFPSITGLATDGSGRFYASDSAANLIQKFGADGVVTLVAGSRGNAGSGNGTGAQALFNQPGGVAAAASGILFVADTSNALIRRVAADGTVTTFAGSATGRGNTDGTGGAATFSAPSGIAVDAAGNVYVADSTNHTIRRITSGGEVTTLAGQAGSSGSKDGTGSAARFDHPAGVAVDTAGNVYVADTNNNTIRRIKPSGKVETLAGLAGVSGSDDGQEEHALFSQPMGVAVDSAGTIYVADTGNSTIRRITASGSVTTLAGLPTISGLQDGTGSNAWFNHPRALAVDGSGAIYVGDTGNSAIRTVSPAGLVATLRLTLGSTNGGGTTNSGGGSSGGTDTHGNDGHDSQAAGGAGGGAPSWWLLASLSLLVWARRHLRRG